MARNMYFGYKVRDKITNEVITSQVHNPQGQTFKETGRACWGDIARNCGYLAEDRELIEINWFVQVENYGSHFRSVEEVVRAFEHFFPKDDKYSLKWEVTGRVLQEVLEGPDQWPEIRIFDFGDYPRQLMMAKLFTIRNMSRYENRTWRAMLEMGVPYPVAATVGAMFHVASGFQGKRLSSESYANVLCLHNYVGTRFLVPTVADLRNFAYCSRYLGEIGEPWSTGNGYLRQCEVMNAVCRPKGVTTNSPSLISIDVRFGEIKPELMSNLIFRLTGKKFDFTDLANKVQYKE